MISATLVAQLIGTLFIVSFVVVPIGVFFAIKYLIRYYAEINKKK